MSFDAQGVAARVNAFPQRPGVFSFAAIDRYGRALLKIELLLPAVIAALLLALLPGAIQAIQTDRQAIIAEGTTRTELLARVLAHELGRAAGSEAPRAGHLTAAMGRLPPQTQTTSVEALLFDANGALVASLPARADAPRRRADLFDDGQPLTVFTEKAGAMTTRLGDGRQAIAALHSLSQGQLAIVQPLDSLLVRSRFWTTTHTTLALTALVGLAGLAGACAACAKRARRARGKFAEMQARVETSLARGRCGVWDWDVSRGRIYWSGSMYGLLGYQQRDEYLSFGEVNALIHAEDGDLAALAERVASAQEAHIEHDFRMRTADGTWLWLRARAEVVQDPKDGSRHLVGIAVDITDERGFVERKTTADMRLHDAVEAISEAFVLWDADNRLVLCNSKFRNFHGLSAQVVVPGASYAEIIQAGRSPLVASHVTRENGDEAGARTLEAQLADGRWLQINERRTKDGGFVSVGTDITALKRQEEKLLSSERRLLGTVTDLKRSRLTLQVQTQQLAELAERYHEQKAQAECANRAKSDFLAKMSHELRTPLNAVIGFAEVMEREMFGPLGHPHYTGYASHIRGSGLNLLGIINDILQISRIEAGHVLLAAKELDLAELAKEAMGTFAKTAREKGVAVTTLFGPDTRVFGDERALRQVLVHLIENAVKFTEPNGAVRIRVARAGDAINLFVEDDGIGIPSEFMPKLGRPFEQAGPEFNRSSGGSGLGLAIAKALTEMNNGRLRIRSREGTGTIVLLHLPAADAGASCSDEPHDNAPLPYLQAAE